MAQVDFSNAIIEPIDNTYPFQSEYLHLYRPSSAVLFSTVDGQYTVASSVTKTIRTNTLDKMSFVYTGTFTRSGTEFALYMSSSSRWKISNIEFNSGDTASFEIVVEISVGD